MTTKVTDIITMEQLTALREAGFVVIHGEPPESMMKAGLSVAKYWDGSLETAYHRMVAESIRLQVSGGAPAEVETPTLKGCGETLSLDQRWLYCGEAEEEGAVGESSLCKECGGAIERFRE